MNWTNLDHFLGMGGYGLYVWASYGLVAAWMLAEPVLAARRHRKALSAAEPTQEQD